MQIYIKFYVNMIINTYIFMQTLKERLDAFLKHMNLSQAKFAEEVGVSVGFANNVGNSISTKSLNKIKNTYPLLDSNWLLTGEGSMIQPKHANEAVLINNANIKLIPLVGQYAQAGYLCGFADTEYIETLPTIPFSVDHHPKGEYVAFEVRGDSMFDDSYRSLIEGDLLMCRKIDKDYWSSKLHFKRWNYFVIVSQEEGVLVKEIIDHDVDNGIVTLHSLNPLYDDIKLHMSTISQIFSVVKIDRSGDK